MPSITLNDTESLLLALLGEEEGRLRSEVVAIETKLRANRMAALHVVFKTRGEEPGCNLLDVCVERDEQGRPKMLTWKRSDRGGGATAAPDV